MRTYGTITFKDAGGDIRPVRIMNPTDVAKLQAIAAAIQAKSNAVWTKVRVDTENGSVGTPVKEPYELIGTKAILSFRNTEDEIFKASIPAPKLAIFDGERVLDAAGADIAAVLTANTDNGTMTFLKGKLWHRPKKNSD